MTIIAIVRAIHILSGVIWVGFAIVLVTLVMPAISSEGRGALGAYMAKSGTRIVGIAAGLTFLSGIYLFATVHRGDTSATGITLGIGALSAILAGALGGAIGGGAGRQLAKLTPGPESAAKAAALRNRMVLGGRLQSSFLILSVICMAIARYV
jgi:hypothetical protein